MIQVLRIAGFLLIGVGALVFFSYFIEPMRQVWPWLVELPLPIRIGLSIAGVGFVLLMSSVIHERWQDLETDRDLLDE